MPKTSRAAPEVIDVEAVPVEDGVQSFEEFTTNALEQFQPTDAKIKEQCAEWLLLKIEGPDDTKGADVVQRALRAAKKIRTGIEGKRKELKADALEFGRRLDARAKQLKALAKPGEDHLQAEQDKYREALAEIERAEQEKAKERLLERMAKLDAVGASTPSILVEEMGDEEFESLLAKKTKEHEGLKALEAEKARQAEIEKAKAEAEANERESKLAAQEAEQERKEAELAERENALAKAEASARPAEAEPEPPATDNTEAAAPAEVHESNPEPAEPRLVAREHRGHPGGQHTPESAPPPGAQTGTVNRKPAESASTNDDLATELKAVEEYLKALQAVEVPACRWEPQIQGLVARFVSIIREKTAGGQA